MLHTKFSAQPYALFALWKSRFAFYFLPEYPTYNPGINNPKNPVFERDCASVTFPLRKD